MTTDPTPENLPLRCRQDPRWSAEEIARLRQALAEGREIARGHRPDPVHACLHRLRAACDEIMKREADGDLRGNPGGYAIAEEIRDCIDEEITRAGLAEIPERADTENKRAPTT